MTGSPPADPTTVLWLDALPAFVISLVDDFCDLADRWLVEQSGCVLDRLTLTAPASGESGEHIVRRLFCRVTDPSDPGARVVWLLGVAARLAIPGRSRVDVVVYADVAERFPAALEVRDELVAYLRRNCPEARIDQSAPLTASETKYLEFRDRHLELHGWEPTEDEAAKDLGLEIRSVARIKASLRRKGRLDYTDRSKPRKR